MKLQYNFRIGPETLWLVGGTVLGTMLIDLAGRVFSIAEWPTLDTWQAWLLAISFNGFRTLIGAFLAAVTGGGFQAPGEPSPEPKPIGPDNPED